MPGVAGHTKIALRFNAYNKEMIDIWESFNLVQFYMDEIHASLKAGNVTPFQFEVLGSEARKTLSTPNLYGAITHLTRKANPRRTLIDAVATSENFLGDLTYVVYMDFPGKLISKQNKQDKESEERQENLLGLIVGSVDREEMIEKLVEEKIRGIFYGNPVAFFKNDKARLEFGNTFNEFYSDQLEAYAEISARRNLFAHNEGRVDRKYLREVKDPALGLGQRAPLDTVYLKHTINILRGLSAKAASLVLTNIYKKPVTGKLASTAKSLGY
jgi:hypothetical protein